MEASLDTKDKIEKIIYKVLYQYMVELKSIKSTKILIDKVLEETLKMEITISEKNIKQIINELKNEKKIRFGQEEGWRIWI